MYRTISAAYLYASETYYRIPGESQKWQMSQNEELGKVIRLKREWAIEQFVNEAYLYFHV
jgi:hypothetical protein